MTDSLPLAGFRIGVTAARKVDEQVGLLERRGATVEWAPALSLDPNHVDDDLLRAATEDVLAAPVDMFLATTDIGMRAWFDAAERWGLLPGLLASLGAAEIPARGPKSVGALRARGLRELWAPESECFEDVLEHLRGLSAEDPGPMFEMVDLIADRSLDAVTLTSAPAVAALMEAAGSTCRRDQLVSAFQAEVVAACVGPVTAAAFEMWGVPTIYPDRSRLGAMVRQLETELPSRRSGLTIELVGGRQLLLHGADVLLDGAEVRLSAAPAAVLNALVANPGNVVSRPALLAMLPSGTAGSEHAGSEHAGSEHAVEMAVARLRAARHPRRADRRQARLSAGRRLVSLAAAACNAGLRDLVTLL